MVEAKMHSKRLVCERKYVYEKGEIRRKELSAYADVMLSPYANYFPFSTYLAAVRVLACKYCDML